MALDVSNLKSLQVLRSSMLLWDLQQHGAKAVEASERSCSLQANSSTTTWYGTHLE